MEELLPDYLFDNISEEDKNYFESNIDSFPELKKDYEESKLVFSKVNKLDINAKFKKESRNISVNVQSQLAKEQLAKNKRYEFRFIPKVLLPSLALFAVGYLLFFNGMDFFNPAINETESYGLFSKIDFNDIESTATENDIDYLIFSEFGEDYTYINESFGDYYGADYDMIEKELNLEYNDINNLIDLLDEDDFQDLLKDMDNAKISS